MPIDAALQEAWLSKNFTLLRSLLSDKLTWYESSFDEPLETADEVVEQWQNDLLKQNNLEVVVKTLDIVGNKLYLHCCAQWDDLLKINHVINGIFVVHVNDDQKIVYFNQWWTSKQRGK